MRYIRKLINTLLRRRVWTIGVEEEYGYRYWVWRVAARDLRDVKAYFEEVVSKPNFFCSGVPSDHLPRGEWEEVFPFPSECDATAHIHEDHDSYLNLPTREVAAARVLNSIELRLKA